MAELFHQKPIEQLFELSQILGQINIRCQLTDASEALPLPSLFAYLDPDAEGRERIIHMSFLPVEEDFKQMRLLQMYFPFPVTIQSGALDTLRVVLLELDTKLPLGHVSVRRNGEIFYRDILPVSRAFVDEDAMGEIFGLFIQVCLSIYDIVDGVASGKVDRDTAMAFLDKI